MYLVFSFLLLAASAYAQSCPPTCGTQGRYSEPSQIAKLEADNIASCKTTCDGNHLCQSFGYNQAKVCHLYSSPLSEQGKHIKKRKSGNALNRLIFYDENCFEPSCDEPCYPVANPTFLDADNDGSAPPWSLAATSMGSAQFNNGEAQIILNPIPGARSNATVSQTINDLIIGYPYTLQVTHDARLYFYPYTGSCTLTAYLGKQAGVAYTITGMSKEENNQQSQVNFTPTARSMELTLEFTCYCAQTGGFGELDVHQAQLYRGDQACQS